MGRDAILGAVITLIATRGPEETTVRKVATEAGVSVGAVQHHFRTKDELLNAAMDQLNEEFLAIVEPILQMLHHPTDKLRTLLHFLACVDERSREGAVIWLAFAARAAVSEELGSKHARNWAVAEEKIYALLTQAYPDSDVTPDDAAFLLAVTDGIAVARAAEKPNRVDSSRAKKIINNALDLLTQQWEKT